MLKTHKIALNTNNKQCTYLSRCAGVSRFAYNWALAEWSAQHEARKEDETLPKPNQLALRRQLNAIKREEFPWMLDVTKCAPQEAIIDLGKAFANFFAGRGKYPRFHKKGVNDSFRVSSGQFRIEGKNIMLPRIGWIRMCETVRFDNAKFLSVTVSRTANRWFASVVCETPDSTKPKKSEKPHVCGVDAGVKEYVDSDGVRYVTPRSYRNAEKRLRRAQQALARKQKGSANRRKQKEKVAKLHARTANIRNDFLHKMTTKLVSKSDILAIEDLNVKGMVKNHHLAKSISDASFGEFRRQLEYKAAEAGKEVFAADRFFPSSKTCSACGSKVKRLSLAVREWTCEDCGAVHDRDYNAALNLKAYAVSSTASACGEFFASGAPTVRKRQATSLKQEENNKPAV